MQDDRPLKSSGHADAADAVQQRLEELNARMRGLGQQLVAEARSLEELSLSMTAMSAASREASDAGARARSKTKSKSKARAKARAALAERWSIACQLYGDLAGLCDRLAALSETMAESFVVEMVETKSFQDRHAIAGKLETAFFDRLCGEREALREYLLSLLARRAWDAVKAFVRYVDVVGPEIEPSLLSAKIEQDFSLDVVAWQSDIGIGEALAVQDPAYVLTVRASEGRGQGTLSDLRRSSLGKFYVERLKHYPPVRSAAIWLWQRGYPVYANRVAPLVFRREAQRWRPLTDIVEYSARSEAGQKVVLAAPSKVETPIPVAFPEKSRAVLVSPHDSYVFPEIFVTTVPDATVYGGTNLVLVNGEVICHNLYNFERDYTSEELHGRTSIDPKNRRVRWLSHDNDPEHLPRAGVFVDACAPNYAHWLTEVFSRVVMFCSDERFADVPLIVNDGLHRNLMESLLLITRGERRIITLPIGRAITVDELYLTSNAGYVPFERRTTRLSGHSHGLFSPVAMGRMRQMLVDVAATFPSPKWPEKIYLRRNSGVRKVINSGEIERAMVARGFSVIEPEKLSFLQQVQLFSGAKVVVASTGAAVANIIFCPPGARISIFISRYADTSYWYWQNIAAASGNVVRYVLGEADPGSTHGIHSDFRVSVDDVLKSL